MVVEVSRGKELKVIFPILPDIEDQNLITQEAAQDSLISYFYYNGEKILSMSVARIKFFKDKKTLATFDTISTHELFRVGLSIDEPDPVPTDYDPVMNWALRLITDSYEELPDGESSFLIEVVDENNDVVLTENGTIAIS